MSSASEVVGSLSWWGLSSQERCCCWWQLSECAHRMNPVPGCGGVLPPSLRGGIFVYREEKCQGEGFLPSAWVCSSKGVGVFERGWLFNFGGNQNSYWRNNDLCKPSFCRILDEFTCVAPLSLRTILSATTGTAADREVADVPKFLRCQSPSPGPSWALPTNTRLLLLSQWVAVTIQHAVAAHSVWELLRVERWSDDILPTGQYTGGQHQSSPITGSAKLGRKKGGSWKFAAVNTLVSTLSSVIWVSGIWQIRNCPEYFHVHLNLS